MKKGDKIRRLPSARGETWVKKCTQNGIKPDAILTVLQLDPENDPEIAEFAVSQRGWYANNGYRYE